MAGKTDPGPAENPLTDRPLLETGAALLEKLPVRSVLVTLSEHGMMLFDREQPPYHTPTRAKEVFDVSGAGDTAIALFTLALCAGGNLAGGGGNFQSCLRSRRRKIRDGDRHPRGTPGQLSKSIVNGDHKSKRVLSSLISQPLTRISRSPAARHAGNWTFSKCVSSRLSRRGA